MQKQFAQKICEFVTSVNFSNNSKILRPELPAMTFI